MVASSGPFVEIQRNVTIGRRCRIQSHAFVCELVTIGDDCFIGHGVMFVNDLFRTGGPARGDRSQWRATTDRQRSVDRFQRHDPAGADCGPCGNRRRRGRYP